MKSILRQIHFLHVIIGLLFIYLVYLIHQEYLYASNGFPSGLDYQNFDFTRILNILILLLYMLSKNFRWKTNKRGWTFRIMLFLIYIAFFIFHERINDLRYYLPLFNIETVEVSGKLSRRNYISTLSEMERTRLFFAPYKSDRLKLRDQIRLEEYPDQVFYLARRRRLENDINILKNDTLFLPEGAVVTLKLRKTDYERMLHGKTNPSISYPDNFDPTSLQFYGLIYEEQIIFQGLGIK